MERLDTRITKTLAHTMSPKADGFVKAKTTQEVFTAAIDFLRTDFPSDRVRTLMNTVWDLIHKHHVVVMMGPQIDTVSFAVIQHEKTRETDAFILIPNDWLSQGLSEPLTVMAGLVFVGAQAVGYSESHLDANKMRIYARVYEAEYMHVLRKTLPDFTPSAYQASLLSDFPNGMDDPIANMLLTTPTTLES